MTRTPEVNCGLICGCFPILPALFQHVRKKISIRGQDHSSNNRRLDLLRSYTRLQRPSEAFKLGGSDIDLDEARLMGPAALNSTKTIVRKGSNTATVRPIARDDQILKRIEIRQSSIRKTEADNGDLRTGEPSNV